MSDLLAKVMALTVGVLLLFAVGLLVVTSRPPIGATQVTAEFDNAFPLIEGMHVRVDGAIAGSVGEIEVNDRGRADVTLNLNEAIEEPKVNATARIAQQDTTGDSFVAFDPGGRPTPGDDDDPWLGDPRAEAEEPLGPDGVTCEDDSHPAYDPASNPCPATLIQPRLDDLLNAFDEPERAGVQLILVELSNALEGRGEGLNKAALELRPALGAANQALAEVNQQNDALKQLIGSAESVTGQAARRDGELARLVSSLERTVRATAAEPEALDAGLERLPQTARRARTMLASLTRASVAGRPLAEQLSAGAPDLASALRRLEPFLDDASAWVDEQRPTLRLTRRLLNTARPTLEIGKERIVTGAFDLIGATAELLDSVLGGEDAFPALFDDDSYGEPGGTLGRRGFGAVAVEPGDLPGYPAGHADRNWLRVSAVINCEVFGAPVEPGCLLDAFPGLLDALPAGAAGRADRAGARGPGSGPDAEAERRPDAAPADGERPLPDLSLPEIELPELELPALDPGRGRDDDHRGGGSRGEPDRALEGLLDFLVR